jgi:hypothetical protein
VKPPLEGSSNPEGEGTRGDGEGEGVKSSGLGVDEDLGGGVDVGVVLAEEG